MAVVEFTPENKGSLGGPSFPTLVLERKGDVARIAALENPNAGFVHTIKAPVLLNGLPKMETVTRKDQTTFQDFAKDFVGRPFCLGDEGVLAERGMDPDHCPVCRAAKDYPDWFAKPDRRFAMHVLVYNTQPGSTTLNSPFSVTVKVWAFTDRVFNSLVDTIKEFGGDARAFDLKLTCANPTFRQYEIQGLMTAEWRADRARTQIAVETFKSQRAADIEELIGRKLPVAAMQDDVDLTIVKWKAALRASGTPVDAGPGLDLTQTPPTNTAPAPRPQVDFDALLGAPIPPPAATQQNNGAPDIGSLLDDPFADARHQAQARGPVEVGGITFNPVPDPPAPAPNPAGDLSALLAPTLPSAANGTSNVATSVSRPAQQEAPASIEDLLAGL